MSVLATIPSFGRVIFFNIAHNVQQKYFMEVEQINLKQIDRYL